MRPRVLSQPVLVLLVALAAGPTRAQEQPSTGGALIGRFWDAIGMRAAPPPPPDFVRNSRAQQLDYKPLAPSPGPTKKRSAAEMQALDASLESAVAANRAKAARVKIPDGGAPAKKAR